MHWMHGGYPAIILMFEHHRGLKKNLPNSLKKTDNPKNQ